MNIHKFSILLIALVISFIALYKLYSKYNDSYRHLTLLPDVTIVWAKQPVALAIEAFSGGNNKVLTEAHLELTNQHHLLISQPVLFEAVEQYTHLIYLGKMPSQLSNFENLQGVELIEVMPAESKLLQEDREFVVVMSVIQSKNYNKIKIYFPTQREAEVFLHKIQRQ